MIRALAPIAHCEGIAVGPDGMLWAGDERGKLFRVDPGDGSYVEVADVGGIAVGLCLDGEGYVYVCVYDRGLVVRVDPVSGDIETYCDSADGRALASPNWPVFDPAGTLYVSDSCIKGGELSSKPTGRIVAVCSGSSEAKVVPTRPLAYSNGMALAPDGTLFVIESFGEPRVLAIRGNQMSVYAELPRTVPDGLALDEEGGLLVSCFQPNLIMRVPPEGGELETVLEDWTGQQLLTPTNMAFFGPERRSLAIASYSGTCLYVVDTPWRGQPLSYPSTPGRYR